jgi:hypothetical protein
MQRDVCSVCGSPHDGHMAIGLDKQGNAMWTCQRCVGQVATIFGLGLDIPRPAETKGGIADTLKRAGVANAFVEQAFGDSAWKEDDREWFAQNPSRTHRIRLPFSGECDAEAANVPAGHTLIVLVRQVEPGIRMRPALCCNANLLPLPDDEAAAHALFEVALGREDMPSDRQALSTLIQKYKLQAESRQ